MLCSRGEWEHCVPDQQSHTPLSQTWLKGSNLELLNTEGKCWNHVSCSPDWKTQRQMTCLNFYILHRWSLLTHCVSIAFLWFCTWFLLLINSLCTGRGAPHVWEKVLRWLKKDYNRSKDNSTLLSVSKDRDCLAVKSWTAIALQFLRVAGHHYLP